jgi:hypothetical protein
MAQAVHKSVNSSLRRHRFLIVIGGDCPCFAGVSELAISDALTITPVIPYNAFYIFQNNETACFWNPKYHMRSQIAGWHKLKNLSGNGSVRYDKMLPNTTGSKN